MYIQSVRLGVSHSAHILLYNRLSSMLYGRDVRSVNLLRYFYIDAHLCMLFMSDDRGFSISYDLFLFTLF